ncbi:MAG: carboxylating nicotinate-nucleotide diphosphorylase [Pseudomonadota bacterium]
MKNEISNIIEIALHEDIGKADITTEATVNPKLNAEAVIMTKERIVVAGQEIAKEVFTRLDPKIKYEIIIGDGKSASPNETIARITGKAQAILTAERTALNFLQRLCGIATLTSKFVAKLKTSKTKLLDTRKTTPGLRELEKEAVRLGGGTNHRFGLFDAYLIKENHIRLAGGIKNAIAKVKKHNKKKLTIEIEVQSIDELKEAIDEGVDIVMLDNFTLEDAREAIHFASGKVKVEISGGITFDNIEKYAGVNPDFISCGEITHSAKAADLTLLIQKTFE